MSWTFKCTPKPTHFNFEVFNSLDELDINKWNNLLNSNNLYLSLDYLKAIEESLQSHINFKYVMFFDV